MREWTSVTDVLEFAIGEEEAAVRFYTQLAGMASAPAMREALLGFAQEEAGHKEKLQAVLRGVQQLTVATKPTMDLQLTDFLVDAAPSAEMTYQDALILAMKKEKSAFKLYSGLAAAVDDDAISALLLSLAQEEAKHKLRFEIEYDEHYLAEN